ncbi:hypothetical protein OGATHE_002808 [Ogataea polymorpha]|uniref:Uncharacterized protein n=1 Tax=Ogataea polymorpha TaxID=460523 RepID=A0A9P8T979_9ASCO|nr:hypothetical protein OGATHE_002808 [Ogataea polymorpha]
MSCFAALYPFARLLTLGLGPYESLASWFSSIMSLASTSGYCEISSSTTGIDGSSLSWTQKIISSLDLGYFCSNEDRRQISNSGSMPFSGLRMVTPSSSETLIRELIFDLEFRVNLKII